MASREDGHVAGRELLSRISATFELLRPTLFREPLGFGDLRGGHALGDNFSIFFGLLLFLALHVSGVEIYPHLGAHIVLWDTQSGDIQVREVIVRNRVILRENCMDRSSFVSCRAVRIGLPSR